MKNKFYKIFSPILISQSLVTPFCITSCGKTCVITFNLGEGLETRQQTIDQDSVFKYIKKPKLADSTTEKTFICWKYADGSRVKPNDKIKSDTTVYAYYRNDIMNSGPCCVYGLTDFTISFSSNLSVPPVLEYSYDKVNWINLSNNQISVPKDSIIYLRSITNSGYYFDHSSAKGSSISFGDNNEVYLGGEISSLLNYPNYFKDSAFRELFKNNTSIIGISPSFFQKNDTGTSLPFGQSCYRNMFSGCSNLEYLPALPAITLNEFCYCEMFSDCINITNIPATMFPTISNFSIFSYQYMFKNCKALRVSTYSGTKFLTIPQSSDIPSSASAPFNGIFSGTGGTYTNAVVSSTPTICYWY